MQTPLCIACGKGNYHISKLLIENGAKLNTIDISLSFYYFQFIIFL